MHLPTIVGGAILIALMAYALTGGADFGGGVWDLLASGPRKAEQRALIARSIGPIWEANHVWLILVVVMVFTAFPAAFAIIGTTLHIPLTIMLTGIVLRGSSFVFRSYGARSDASQRRWGLVFSSTSVITPLFLGVIVGAIASGRAGSPDDHSFADTFIWPWLSPFPLLVGAMALSLFAFLAAVYLAVAAEGVELRDDFRLRALAAAGGVFLTAFGALGVGFVHAQEMTGQLTSTPWAFALHAATGISALAAIAALYSRRLQAARVAAAAQVSLILLGWGVAQYPYVIPPWLTLSAAAAPQITLELLLWALAGGSVVLLPSLAYLYRNFARPTSGEH